MALPPNKRPLNYRIPSHLYHKTFESIGAASMCWDPRPGDQVFKSEEASKIAVDLCFAFADELDLFRAGQLAPHRPSMDELAHRETVPELWSDKRSPRKEGEIYVCHDYLKIYEREWAKWRDQPIRLMEIGLNVGASIKLWLDYFTQADIVGVDIADFQSKVGLFDPNRFNFLKGDQFDVNFWNEVKSKYPNGFDIIIDDGAHSSGAIQTTFACMWGAVKPGGYYVIEDLGECWNNPASHTKGYMDQLQHAQEIALAAYKGELDIAEVYCSKELCILRKK